GSYGFFNYGTDEYVKGGQWGEMYAQDEYNDYTTEMDGHDKEAGQADINDLWAETYNGIDRCNVAIDKIPLVEDGIGFLKDQQGKDIRMGEVRFLRGYFYFILVQQFGAVPLTLEPSSGLELEWERTPAAEVYEAIVADLKYAVENLPETQSQFGRITKNAARHYLAKVYLTRASSTNNDPNDRNFYRGGDKTADLQAAAQLIEDIEASGRHSLVPDYRDLFLEGKEVNTEVILSIQFNDVEGLNGVNGSSYKNQLHEFWFQQYDKPAEQGMTRNIEYGRPFRRMYPTDYALDIHDRLNDSRLRKSLLEVFYSTSTDQKTVNKWTSEELLFAFENVAPDGAWAIKNGDTIYAGDYKFTCATAKPESDTYVNVGDTALVFLLNDKNTTLTDRDMVAAGYTIYARYYWRTDANRNPVELVETDNNDHYLFVSEHPVEGSSNITVRTWNRDKSPSLIKYWDRKKPGGFDSHVGTRDVFIARLGESYLIAAEAYGRLGDYAKAAYFINKLRNRAAYKEGEEKPNFWHMFDGGTPGDKSSTAAALQIDASYWDSDKENEMYPDYVASKEARFIHFILNERCREMLGELVRWEDLTRTGTLVERTLLFNNDTRNYGNLQAFHYFRPLPQPHLDGIQRNGQYLTPAEKDEYQNEGY
ncbi:MAG TPA: RagB/SusD family nutrient uptake outer membrane protein, partial [Prolixibacteraceae bacterium]|nr:RagB/SusD family nutrient uptake outer membrane protein [Prolixibacteraceae bacterium]